jgi:hypothetical protein
VSVISQSHTVSLCHWFCWLLRFFAPPYTHLESVGVILKLRTEASHPEPLCEFGSLMVDSTVLTHSHNSCPLLAMSGHRAQGLGVCAVAPGAGPVLVHLPAR